MSEKLNLACDYMQGAHPAILSRMTENNLVKSGVYGYDDFSESAKEKIRAACEAPNADICFWSAGHRQTLRYWMQFSALMKASSQRKPGTSASTRSVLSSTADTKCLPCPELTAKLQPARFRHASTDTGMTETTSTW